MESVSNKKVFDLNDRTLIFAKRIREFINKLPRTISNLEDSKQLVRSSGSIGANYREAEDALSRKDFVHRIKISRKEAKESIYWLNLIEPKGEHSTEKEELIQEAEQLMKIFWCYYQEKSAKIK
jgi:four helix bundle protein